jgi:hypothetical protein
VDELRANALIGNNIIVPKKINILLSNKKITISTYKVTANIQVRLRSSTSRHLLLVYTKATTIVPPYLVTKVVIHTITAKGRDFLFELEESKTLSFFAHLVD